MIVVDGSQGEGGGQILRTAVSISAVSREPVKVTKIRAGRPNPGLAPGHVTSIEVVASLCDARVDGLHRGSTEISFHPGELLGGDFRFDIGTAGSISLVIQGCLLPALLSKAATNIALTGGTDVRWSPPVDYIRMVHLPVIAKLGAGCELELISRGFYPEGGGEVNLAVHPTGGLLPISLTSPGDLKRIRGVSYSQDLPEHVPTRMRHAAMKKLLAFPDVKLASERSSGKSVGAGIVLAAECERTVLGASALGERGVRAETLGESCAEDLVETVRSGAAVDEHMLDQILPYIATADGASTIVAESLTEHARTNMLVIEQMLGRTFSVDDSEDLVSISID